MNLVNEEGDSGFVARTWNSVNDQSNANHDVGNEGIYNAEILKSNLCDYNDAYILVRDDITIVWDNGAGLAFKNYAPFLKCIKKTDWTTIDDFEDIDLVIKMRNL